ncbi:asparaginase [Bacillus sp. FJAT-49705]|uniref:Asparaginase n=1 Tax=Cytobacillus citreus TaxID=2833586 RepID=A0ABS5NQR9_9BACI|nr:asparaginase [Cytobacillus citreus]MBS4190166.1 asparaginase [Cytobacillus citreus]
MVPTKLVDVYRGRRVESSHYGHVAVVNAEGQLLYSAGDPYRVTYARSAVKPIQTIPVVETGAADYYELSNPDLSLCCASHSGEAQHTDRVLAILKRAGIEDVALQCGTHIPHAQDTYKSLIAAGKDLTPLYNNCSGKHSGMLVTAKFMGETLEDYYLPDHPVQQRILKAISEVTDFPMEKIEMGTDGCGVPVHALPLERLAYGFARMADPKSLGEERAKVVNRITTAMMEFPEMVGGTGRFCTDFMKSSNGRLFGKAGAEGVYLIGDRETGIGIAIKIEDGNGRAAYPTALKTLKQIGLIEEEQINSLMHHYRPALKNARQENIGELVPSFTLQKCSSAIVNKN